jgi:hypothetical protein
LSRSTDDPTFRAHNVPASKYVTKSTNSWRPLVSVNDDIPTLTSLARTDGMIASKAASRYSGMSPSVRATAFIKSTSKPTMCPEASLNSAGG